jgi:hypothetical protein
MASGTNLTPHPTLPQPGVLWTVNLGPPILWLLQFQVRYALVPWCCANGNRSLLWLASGISVFLVLVFTTLAICAWKRLRPELPDEAASVSRPRARFMALVGLMSSGLFGLATVAQALPVWWIDPCIQ